MDNKLKLNSHESLKIGIILSLVGGILDAHTFLFRNGVFANTQTGNIVLLALFLNTEKTKKTIQCVLSIFAFVFGIFLTEFFKKKIKDKFFLNHVSITLIVEILLLFFTSTFSKNEHNTTTIVIISFVCSLQTNVFKSLKGSTYATTMCTGNLRTASSNLFNGIFNKTKKEKIICLRYFIIILSFFSGALIGRFLTNIIFQKTLLVCCFLLTVALLNILFSNKKLKNKKLK